MSNRIEKIATKPDDIYKFLKEYLRQFDVDWINRIEPASKEEILKLKRVSGVEERGYNFPEEYLTFLSHMGRNDGGLISNSYDGYTNINDIIEHYEMYGEELYEYEDEIERNQLIFFISFMTGEAGFFLDLKEDGSHDVRSSSDDQYHKDSYAGSFDKFLVQTAVMLYEQKKYRNKIYFGGCWNDIKEMIQKYGDEKVMQTVYYIAEKHGFKTAWFSDKWHYLGFKENTCLSIHRDFAFGGYIGSDNMNEVGSIVEELNKLLNTKIQETIFES